MRERAVCVAVFISMLAATAGHATGEEPHVFPGYEPIVPQTGDYPLGQYWTPYRYPGGHDFYWAEMGNYYRPYAKNRPRLYQTGLLDQVIPGHWDIRKFDPAVFDSLSPLEQQCVRDFQKNKWPMQSHIYNVCFGRPMPSEAAFEAVKDFWMGDGSSEAPVYRLDSLMSFLRTGEWAKVSSFRAGMEGPMTEFGNKQLLPRVEKELPFCHDPKHPWTREELTQLSDIFIEEYTREAGKPICWNMWLNPWCVIRNPNVTTVAEKGADALSNARARGVIRQSGGDKLYFTWRGHEPTERYGYETKNWQCRLERDDWGYPLALVNYYFFRPFLIGANCALIESHPGLWIQDLEADGQFELSELGRLGKRMLDYTRRHPERGSPYAPVALLKDYNRYLPLEAPGKLLHGFLDMDDADMMTAGLVEDLLFCEHRHTKFTGGYFYTAPYGEIFDILAVDPSRAIDPLIFDGYKVLFALGGVAIDEAYATALQAYVKGGGTLVVNIADAGKHLPETFLGVRALGPARAAGNVRNTVTGNVFPENEFTLTPLELVGAEALYTAGDYPVVTVNPVGAGRVILTAAHYLIQNAAEEALSGRWRRKWMKKPLLTFVPDFMERLTAGLTPFDIRVRPEDKPDISWLVNRKGDGWTVTLFNYSLKREELVHRRQGTASIVAEYPYKPLPFEIVCRAPMTDVMELYQDRDVDWDWRDRNMVVSETIRGGDIRVYEFQPQPIEMKPYTRFKNHARNRPVAASSFFTGYEPTFAVDGNRDNTTFWQSGFDLGSKPPGSRTNRNAASRKKWTSSTAFPMPQWIEIDLEDVRDVDHVYVQFHVWPRRSMEKRQYICRYTVEVSEDRQNWQTVIDESQNMDPAHPDGLERWFEPTRARYVKLTVLRNTANAGAQVVELSVMGAETETYTVERRSILPKWHVRFPAGVADMPADRVSYLVDREPRSVKPGWMPANTEWHELNGAITLYADRSGQGLECPKSLYGESISEIVYEIPEGASTFVSTIGFGTTKGDASVEFKVLVDETEKYDSGIYRFGKRLQPVVVDVKGAKSLTLIVTDAGDGLRNDYAWWGDARFLLGGTQKK